jgi:hypothetical protein
MVRSMVVLFTASLTLLGVASAQAIPVTTSGRVNAGILFGSEFVSESAPPQLAIRPPIGIRSCDNGHHPVRLVVVARRCRTARVP